MRKILLASAAILSSAGVAFAQAPSFQNQGQTSLPWAGGPAPNNNNNAMGIAGPGGYAVPKPGEVVIHLNGKVYAEVDASFGSMMQVPPNAFSGQTSNAGYKMNPIGMASYFRLYPGVDAMATNGLRYGASVEIRENFEGGNTFPTSQSQTQTSGSASSASGVTSAQTLFVRRAFTYLGSDKVGIVRLGNGDGLVSLFDYTGVFTVGSWDGGIGNILNAGVQAVTPNQYLLDWAWLSGNGVEYGNTKAVYLTPQFFGFDFGVEYDPNMGNSFSNSATSSPYQTGPCVTASSNCIGVTSSNDPTRWYNRVAVGARYMGSFAGLDVKGYGVFITSAKNSTPYAAGGNTALGQAIHYDGLNEFNGGFALTYAGFTFNGDFTSGRTNGSNAMDPTGGAIDDAELLSVSYANGPWSVGVIGAVVDNQGSATLVHVSQRHEFAFAVGGAYKIAPGMNIALEYQYEQKHQGDFNWLTQAVGSSNNNDMRVQGVQLATIMNW